MQRFFDILFSSTALIILSPILIIIILILKQTGEGEILFFQKRIGKEGISFKLYKFATMLKNSENIGTGTLTIQDDPRILPFGKFLRKTKLNELPQLINVLMGDMSVIGPRPQAQRNFDAYKKNIRNKITYVRPGLSGIGSIIFRNEEEMMQNNNNSDDFYDNIIMQYKGELELWYINKRNIVLYFLLIISTVVAVVSSKNNIIYFFYNDIPKPPNQLKSWIKR
tara:strand:+ start:34132 stop:34803 length:672 start_codon:yes stop_codon:yes gene_type:complete